MVDFLSVVCLLFLLFLFLGGRFENGCFPRASAAVCCTTLDILSFLSCCI